MSDDVQLQRDAVRKRQNANLIHYKPGQSGNPAGKPCKISLTALLRKALAKHEIAGQPTPNNKTAAEILVEVAIGHASKGNSKYFKEIFDRIDGKVPDQVEIRDMRTLSDAELERIAAGTSPGDIGTPTTGEAQDEQVTAD